MEMEKTDEEQKTETTSENPSQTEGIEKPGSPEELNKKVIAVLHTCYDPEIPVDIYDLGLIYNIDVPKPGTVNLEMTLTSPMCPVAETLPPEVEGKIRNIVGVLEAKVSVVWDPPWNMDMMTQAAKLKLNMM